MTEQEKHTYVKLTQKKIETQKAWKRPRDRGTDWLRDKSTPLPLHSKNCIFFF